MGVNDREQDRKLNKRAKAKEARSRRASMSGEVDLAALEWLPLAALAEALMREGGALRIGLTRDGGAVALGVYHEDDYATEYIRPAENFRDAVAEISAAWLNDGGAWYMDRLIALDTASAR